jgi:putative membrane protein
MCSSYDTVTIRIRKEVMIMMMMGYGGGIWIWWLMQILVVITIIFFFVKWLRKDLSLPHFEKRPEDILKERFAKGEISEQEYYRMREVLRKE